MRSQEITLLLLIPILLLGCNGRAVQRAGDAPPADEAMLASVRQTIQRTYPEALVGRVAETLPNEPFAAVTDVPLEAFHVGELITFMDTNQNALTNGVIRRITENALHVQYDPPRIGGRSPRPGDLAVRLRQEPEFGQQPPMIDTTGGTLGQQPGPLVPSPGPGWEQPPPEPAPPPQRGWNSGW
jgi:hypothetical protein